MLVKFSFLIFFGLLFNLLILFAQTHKNNSKVANANLIKDSSPKIDGILKEAVWNRADSITDFVQKDPVEGASPTFKIVVKFLYDHNALFIGARIYRDNPDNIQTTVSRRDNAGNSEKIKVSIDSYRDLRTAYTFGLTASGVQIDYYHSTDHEYNRDHSYNPVWKGETNIDSIGWTAEFRIPFTQIRFNEKDEQIWGLNINCWIPTLQEDLYWVLIPKKDRGWSSRMGVLTGIKGIQPSNRIEIMPYIASDVKINPNYEKLNPYMDYADYAYRAGLDLKMGLGPNLTLDATINPDFGQVEADPAVVNLSAFETLFGERRPFFTEGRQLIQGNGPSYFYSRRIGARPHGSVDGDYISSTDNTNIIGAAKITGRSDNGLSIGALTAVTAREFGDYYIDSLEISREAEIEPLTSYSVVRLQQEFGENASTIGIMLTGVSRDLNDDHELSDILSKNAITGGFDWNIRFNRGEYQLNGHFGFSHVNGNAGSILKIQESSAHYYQRPDAKHIEVDSSATSISGYTGALNFSRQTGDHWLWGVSSYFETPGFELNDIGMLQSADDIALNAHLNYRETEPGKVFHSYNFGASIFDQANFDWDNKRYGGEIWTNFTFLNRSNVNLNYLYNFAGINDDLTRGGPLMGVGSNWSAHAGYSSDFSSNLQWNVNTNINGSETGSKGYNMNFKVSLRFAGRYEISLGPMYSKNTNSRQYFTTLGNGRDETYGNRYIFSFIDRNTLSARFRFNVAFTNKLTLELYAEPFAASGRYYRFGELSKPKSIDLIEYGTNDMEIERQSDGTYRVTADEDEFILDNNDFNYLSFRSNLVIRWEWMPGSTFFLVWQQNKSNNFTSEQTVDLSSLTETFDADGINSIALKFSYWLPVN